MLILAVVMVGVLLAGCFRSPAASPTPMRTSSPAPVVTPLPTPTTTLSPSPAVLTPGASPSMTPGTTLSPAPSASASTVSGADMSKKIAEEIDKISEVASSSVAIVGDSALIGIQFDQQYKGELTTRIKDMVAEKAKAADPNIKRVAVSADPDIVTRVKAMMADLQSGKSVGSEFTEIVNRLSPVVS